MRTDTDTSTDNGIDFGEFAGFLRKCGYVEREPREGLRVFYEFGTLDFLSADCAKKYEVEYEDGKVNKATMVQYWYGRTAIKEITSLEELYGSI